jgi:tripartite-type tricarboxylate transporter receptor subunit TctC
LNDHPSTLRRALLQAFAATAASPAAWAQSDWPKGQPIHFVVPFTAGSGTDIIARTVGDKLGPALGTNVVIDNKPGAGGTLGAARKAGVTETVAAFAEFAPRFIPLPHPSPRNTGWFKHHPWFESEVLPVLRERVRRALAKPS